MCIHEAGVSHEGKQVYSGEELLSARLIAIFVIFFVSVIGFALPLVIVRLKETNSFLKSNTWRCMKCVSSGVIIGVAFLHLLADSQISLACYTDYPLSMLLCLVGFLITLLIEHSALSLVSYINSRKAILKEVELKPAVRVSTIDSSNLSDISSRKSSLYIDDHSHDHNHSAGGDGDSETCCTDDALVPTTSAAINDIKELTDYSLDHTHGDHGDVEKGSHIELYECRYNDVRIHEGHAHSHHLHHEIVDEIPGRALVKAIIIEISIAIHSIIIGFDLGILTANHLTTIKTLTAAFAIHQLFEGLSIGASLVPADLSDKVKLVLCFCFSISLPIGIIIGIGVQGYQTFDDEIIAASASCIAAGSLLYSGFVEMISEDFHDAEVSSNMILKLKMFLSVIIGVAFMAILALFG